jgi:hypothetical protein
LGRVRGTTARLGLPCDSPDNAPVHAHRRGTTGRTNEYSGIEVLREMSLPTGRGAYRRRSCGRAKKREGMGKPVKVGGAEVGSGWAVFIGALLIDYSIDNARFAWGCTRCKAIDMPRPSCQGQTVERLVRCVKRSGPLQAWSPGRGDDPGSGCVRRDSGRRVHRLKGLRTACISMRCGIWLDVHRGGWICTGLGRPAWRSHGGKA